MTVEKQRPAPPPEWMQGMVRAVSNQTLRDIVNDSRSGPTPPSSLAASVKSEKPRFAATAAAVPLGPPAGIEHIDRLVEDDTRRPY